jgi:copper resistance protein B
MSNNLYKGVMQSAILSILCAAFPTIGAAQEMTEHDHHQMNTESTAEEQQHSQTSDTSADELGHSQMDHSQMSDDDMSEMSMDHTDMAMNHSMMNMQGGVAPADARDPHAYSGGFTLSEGPYSLPSGRQLHLADEHSFFGLTADRLEYSSDSDAIEYDVQGWYGLTYDRAMIKAEGEVQDGDLQESQTELLWSHAVTAYWDTLLGVRLDKHDGGESRQWMAFGWQGLAPYWFEMNITAYVGEAGHTALSAETEYELLLTQRWVLQSRAEITLYGHDDAVNQLGKGLSSLSLDLRLRYDISRQFSPYIGLQWSSSYGNTADFARLNGESAEETNLLAGLRFMF